MSESEFLAAAEGVLNAVESAFEQAGEAADVDIECSRSGNVLEIEFANRSKMIVNTQAPMREIWVAARAGGFHYRFADGCWLDTRAVKAGERAGGRRSEDRRLNPAQNISLFGVSSGSAGLFSPFPGAPTPTEPTEASEYSPYMKSPFCETTPDGSSRSTTGSEGSAFCM